MWTYPDLRPLLVVALILLLTPALAEDKPRSDVVHKIDVAKAQRVSDQDQEKIYCVVDSPLSYQISSENAGRLIYLLPVGSMVEAGQLVAEQDGFYIRQDLQALELEIKLSRAELVFARTELSALKRLKAGSLISTSQLNEYALSVTRAEIKLEQAAQTKLVLEHKLTTTRHLAPAKGQILKLSAAVGEHLAVGEAILGFLPVMAKQLRCQLPFAGNQTATSISGLSFAYQQTSLQMREVSRYLDETTQDLTLYLNINPSQHSRFTIGQRVQVRLNRQQQLVRVPYDALSLVDGSYQLWRLEEDATVSRIFANIISTSEHHFVIESALKVGDSVVVRGQGTLKESNRVQLVLPADEDLSDD